MSARASALTSAHAVLVPVLVLILVEVAVEAGAALDAVRSGHGAVAVLSTARGAHSAAAAVVQHGARTARGAAARGVAPLWAVHCVLHARAPRRQLTRLQRHEHGQEQQMMVRKKRKVEVMVRKLVNVLLLLHGCTRRRKRE